MARKAFTSAALTGLFCMGFSVTVSWLTMTLSMTVLILLSFVSGFLGSLFARVVLRGNDG